MKSFFAATLAALLALGAVAADAAIITQWNFNSNPSDASTGTGTTVPSTGAGTVQLVGTTATFAGGGTGTTAPGSSTDPNNTDDSGYNTTGYPAQGTGDKTEGLRWNVSTAGFYNIMVAFDQRHSNTSANTVVLQYTLDGSVATPTWVDAATFVATAGDTWHNGRSADLSSVGALGNNPNAAFRVVSSFAAGGSAYVASTTGSSYATTGTFRFDMVTVSGTVIPEPSAGLLALVGLGAASLRRRNG